MNLQFLIGLLIGVSISYTILRYVFYRNYTKFCNETSKKMQDICQENQAVMANLLTQQYNKGAKDMMDAVREKVDSLNTNRLKNPKTLTIATGNLSMQNALRINIPGIRWKKNMVAVIKDFQAVQLIGKARPFFEEGMLKAEIELDGDFIDFATLTPAMCGTCIESHEEVGATGIIRVIDNFELTSLSLCTGPNVDPSIEPIYKQLDIHLKNTQ